MRECATARREGCSCGSGGGGARRTPLGSSRRSFSARSRVVQSPVCWAMSIEENRSMSLERNGPWKDFGICLCVGTEAVSVSSKESTFLLHVALAIPSVNLVCGHPAAVCLHRRSTLFSVRPLHSYGSLSLVTEQLWRCRDQLSGSRDRDVAFEAACQRFPCACPSAWSRQQVRVGQRASSRPALGRGSGTQGIAAVAINAVLVH